MQCPKNSLASVEEILPSIILPLCQRGLTFPADPPPKLYKLCSSGPTDGPDLYNLYNLGGASGGSNLSQLDQSSDGQPTSCPGRIASAPTTTRYSPRLDV